jgi:hypothetical protein
VKTSAEISNKIVKMAEKISSSKGLAASADIASKAPARLTDVNSIADLETQYEVKGVINYGTCMQPEKVDPDELRNFLNLHQQLRHEPWAQTQYIKLVCFLDWIENGQGTQSHHHHYRDAVADGGTVHQPVAVS